MTDTGSTNGWEDVLEQLEERRVDSRSMGGDERLAKHRGAGKLDVRARIEHLLDPGSFQELGTLVGGEEAPADAIVMGSGRIDGRPVMVAAEDFTVKAGTISQAANSKRYRVAELAVADRVPLVMMLEGAGFRADGERHGRTPTDLLAQARCSGRVPLVTAVLGASAGHGALVAPMSDFSVMSRHGAIFTAGPPVVLESMGETITKEDLGGPGVAVPSGLIHNVGDDDAAALDLVRTYLRYFPSSAWSYPPDVEDGDTGPRLVPELLDIVPRNGRRVYDMRKVIDVVFDADSAFEVQPDFGRPIITALCRLGGHPVAVIANQPPGDGRIDRRRRRRQGRALHHRRRLVPPPAGVPVRQPGRAARQRVGASRASCARARACTPRRRMATSPKFEVTLRKAYGFGSMVMGMIPFDGQSGVFAFPGATMGAMGAAAMSRARGSDDDEAAAARTSERSRRRTARPRPSASTS